MVGLNDQYDDEHVSPPVNNEEAENPKKIQNRLILLEEEKLANLFVLPIKRTGGEEESLVWLD